MAVHSGLSLSEREKEKLRPLLVESSFGDPTAVPGFFSFAPSDGERAGARGAFNCIAAYFVIVSFRLSSTLATAVIAASSILSIDAERFDSPTLMKLSAAFGSERKWAHCCS